MKLFSRVYSVAYCKDSKPSINSIKNKYELIKNNHFSWAADPFPVEHDGQLYIFAEIFQYINCKGAIGYTKLTKSGFSEWKIIIREKYHLSFPNIFQIDDIYYMCPESNNCEEIYLYKCIEFPDKWEKSRVIVTGGHYVDTVFTNVGEKKYGITYELNKGLKIFDVDTGIFSTGEIETTEIENSRPGGKIINYDGKRIIVSQIGGKLYGAGLIFKEFEINWPNYMEKELFRIYPKDIRVNKEKNYNGVHTFNYSENYTVIDLIRYQFNPIEKLFKLVNKIRAHV